MAPKSFGFGFKPNTKLYHLEVTKSNRKGGAADEVNVLIKSFHSPEASSRPKSRQQKAFTSLTQH